MADSDGSNFRRLDTGSLAGGASYWSPDGDHIAFHARIEEAWGVYVLPVGGGVVVKVSD
jgi:Tol biopolymer transport system component